MFISGWIQVLGAGFRAVVLLLRAAAGAGSSYAGDLRIVFGWLLHRLKDEGFQTIFAWWKARLWVRIGRGGVIFRGYGSTS